MGVRKSGSGGLKKKSEKKANGILRKGVVGTAANYITRNMALKKLQLSLPDFRRLCILKGIYPREPKKKVHGRDKTYYLSKDIVYLLHEPMLATMRAIRAHKRKVKKAAGRHELSSARRIHEARPKTSLDHIIKERYPTFPDALRDLDDALSMVFLFSQLPAEGKIDPVRTKNCARLAREFELYVAKTHSLTKVFLSIKGIYYQAVVFGQTVTWLSPFQFAQELTTDVDYRVMLTFLEFYEVMMNFINFKLYSSVTLRYPPAVDQKALEAGFGLQTVVEESSGTGPIRAKPGRVTSDDAMTTTADAGTAARLKTLKEKLKNTDRNAAVAEVEPAQNDEESDDDDFKIDEDPEVVRRRSLFKGKTIFISRECPRRALEFVIRSFGGRVVWNEKDINADFITHQVMDRPSQKRDHMSRDYVQPQWIFDSVNCQVLLPVEEYGIGATLPPHLSPFISDEGDEYLPDRRKEQLRQMQAAGQEVPSGVIDDQESSSDDEEDDDANEDSDDEEVDPEELAADLRHQAELQRERKQKRGGASKQKAELVEDQDDVLYNPSKDAANVVANAKETVKQRSLKKKGKDAAVVADPETVEQVVKKATKRKAVQDEKEKQAEKDEAKLLLSNRKRKLYNSLQGPIDDKKAEKDRLNTKKKKLKRKEQ